MMTILPEKKVEIEIWDWLMVNNKYIKQIYFNNSKNLLQMPFFKVKGKRKIPDLLIEFDQGYGTEFIIVEVKDNSKNKNVRDSIKIINYYEDYITNQTNFLLTTIHEIKINHFIVASQGSKFARIYNNTDSKIINNSGWQVKYNQEPLYEFERTRDFQRTLFASFKLIRDKYNLKKNTHAPSIGILIDELLINGGVLNSPHIFVMRKATKGWRAAFIKI